MGSKMSNEDGIALRSMAHPAAPWWRRLLFLFRRPQLSEDAIETVEIDPSLVSKTGFKIGKLPLR
jgi:hypothetical protein